MLWLIHFGFFFSKCFFFSTSQLFPFWLVVTANLPPCKRPLRLSALYIVLVRLKFNRTELSCVLLKEWAKKIKADAAELAFSRGACRMLQGRLSSCCTKERSSSTISSFWFWDFPPPERYLCAHMQAVRWYGYITWEKWKTENKTAQFKQP